MDEFNLRLNLSKDSESDFVKIENKRIEVNNNPIISSNGINSRIHVLQFINCDFSGTEIIFEGIKNPDLQIYFKDCSFNCRFYFIEVEIGGLKFLGTKKIGSLINIQACKLEEFFFKGYRSNENSLLKGSIIISSNQITKKLNFENLNLTEGDFEFEENIVKTLDDSNGLELNASFANSKLHNASFHKNEFDSEVKFDKMILSYDAQGSASSFNDCKFQSAYFNQVDFGGRCFFNGSMFKNSALFVNCQNYANTLADFSGCIFYKDAFFNFSEFKSITIKNTQFMGITSFENTKFKEVELERNIFEKAAFFDAIEITKLDSCNRKTLRTIKQELQRTENRIDYNVFKVAELNAYKKELSPDRWKEVFILWLNKISSNHGMDWFRGIIFTMLVGFIFYIIYFASENYKLSLSLKFDSINHFLIGYFSFLLPSYKSPFSNGLTQWYQYFPFLIGKIFIAYGIYQTIHGFRKFRL